MRFGKYLLAERKKQGLSAMMLASRCGTSRSYITLIEVGMRLPAKKLITVIASALGLRTTVVLNWYLEDLREKFNEEGE